MRLGVRVGVAVGVRVRVGPGVGVRIRVGATVRVRVRVGVGVRVRRAGVKERCDDCRRFGPTGEEQRRRTCACAWRHRRARLQMDGWIGWKVRTFHLLCRAYEGTRIAELETCRVRVRARVRVRVRARVRVGVRVMVRVRVRVRVRARVRARVRVRVRVRSSSRVAREAQLLEYLSIHRLSVCLSAYLPAGAAVRLRGQPRQPPPRCAAACVLWRRASLVRVGVGAEAGVGG